MNGRRRKVSDPRRRACRDQYNTRRLTDLPRPHSGGGTEDLRVHLPVMSHGTPKACRLHSPRPMRSPWNTVDIRIPTGNMPCPDLWPRMCRVRPFRLHKGVTPAGTVTGPIWGRMRGKRLGWRTSGRQTQWRNRRTRVGGWCSLPGRWDGRVASLHLRSEVILMACVVGNLGAACSVCAA